MNKKDNSVQSLRGLAIILIVMAHVIGYTSKEVMKAADHSFLRYLYYTFEYFRLPLFSVISGWAYSLRPISKDTWASFLTNKTRRLILPMIFVGLLYFFARLFAPGINRPVDIDDLWKIFVFKYDLYWFLPSLFWVFIMICLVEVQGWIKKFNGWLLFLIISLSILSISHFYLTSIPNYFGVMGSFYLLPFFIVGIGIERFRNFLFHKTFLWVIAFIFPIGILLQQLFWFGFIDFPFQGKASPLGLLVGISGAILLFKIHFISKWLVYIGGYSYTIFLFHAFGTAGSRIILTGFGLTNQTILFSVSLIVGLILPILIDTVIDRYKITRLLLLGKKTIIPNS